MDVNDLHYQTLYGSFELIKTNTTNISIDILPAAESIITGTIYASIAYTGESGTGKNVPPFRGMYFIMKISGPDNTGVGSYLA